MQHISHRYLANRVKQQDLTLTMTIFEKLESSFVANWLIDSLYGYPIMLVCHGIGMSIVILISAIPQPSLRI